MVSATVTNNSGEATVYIGTNPIQQGGEISYCDDTFNYPSAPGVLSGVYTYYKTFVYRVSTSGQYTFTLTTTNFSGRHAALQPELPSRSAAGEFERPGHELHHAHATGQRELQLPRRQRHQFFSVGTFGVKVTGGPAL
jgi:hypothetical protein